MLRVNRDSGGGRLSLVGPCTLHSSAMLVLDNRNSSADGAFGRHEQQDRAGIRLVTAASVAQVDGGWCPATRGSTPKDANSHAGATVPSADEAIPDN